MLCERERASEQTKLMEWYRSRVTVVYTQNRRFWADPDEADPVAVSPRVRSSSVPHTPQPNPLRDAPPIAALDVTSPKAKGAVFEYSGFPLIEEQVSLFEGDATVASSSATPRSPHALSQTHTATARNARIHSSLTRDGHPVAYLSLEKIGMASQSPLVSGSSRLGMTSRHLVVCVHGFGGNSFDLRQLSNYISLQQPRVLFMHSSSNEKKTNDSIQDMGERLAKEIIGFVRAEPTSIQQVSIIAHSLGGVVARAAISNPLLASLAPKFHTFVSISCPHLGYMYNHNSYSSKGLWLVLKMFRNARSLQQLALQDHRNFTETILYKLSEQRGLGLFNHVILLSSTEDGFVPYHSARMEIFPAAMKDPVHGPVYTAMANNIFSQMNNTHLVRLDVNFNHSAQGFNKAFGRAAHILFLDNARFCHMFASLYHDYFS
eukprot:c11725_g1_i2.p1 GENE.c11725_g1_i2~~c11725_g1_i2.p1  ORF type:complete len:433 (-),score=101.95 c11725_g1_i2:73-1371(-)